MDEKDSKQDGKLKYVNGIPYLSGPDIRIETIPLKRYRATRRWMRLLVNLALFLGVMAVGLTLAVWIDSWVHR